MKRSLVAVVLVILLSMMAFVVVQAEIGQGFAGPGKHITPLVAGQNIDAGVVGIFNSQKNLIVEVEPSGDWKIIALQVYAGLDPVPTRKGSPTPGKFTFKKDFSSAVPKAMATLSLKDELDFSWGRHAQHVYNVAVHVDLVQLDPLGEIIAEEGAWAFGPEEFESAWGTWLTYYLAKPQRGHFIDSPVVGIGYHTPSFSGVTKNEESDGGFLFFPDEEVEFSLGSIALGSAIGAQKITPLDLFTGSDIDDPRVVNMAWLLQSLDDDGGKDGKIVIHESVITCLEGVVGGGGIDFADSSQMAGIIADFRDICVGAPGLPPDLTIDLTAAEAQANLESGLNYSGIFRKNVSKTEDFGESKQKLEIMPVYLPGLQSNGEPSLCVDANGDKLFDEGDEYGVPYQEWRIGGDPAADTCDPRLPEGGLDPNCILTTIECREVAKPIIVTYTGVVDIYDENKVTTEFWDGRFSTDIFTAVSRDDGTTWKRMNVSRMADLTSFDLETGEPFPGTNGSPYLQINDNYILNVWESKFCKSGTPRYAIDNCSLYPDDCVDADNDGLVDDVCRGDLANGTLQCEEDYPYDDEYYVTDIWGVRGQQRSVDYNEVDDVADLGIGEIPYSCLWAARGVIVTQKELDAGTFASLTVVDDPETEEDESDAVELGDIIWFKPERLTSGRRDAYIPVVNSARGAGFAIAWQEDPSGLRPGKGKGPGEGWSGAISNHKTDIWYSFISVDDFAVVDANFLPGGPPESGGPDDRPGLGRPKAMVPFSLPVRISDNDMVNTDTLKVELEETGCVTPENGSEEVCFPTVEAGSFVPLDPEEIASQFCGHPEADPATCCDPDNHQGDPNCEDLKGLYGNMTGTKRYAYLARSIDNDLDNVPDYQYYVDRGGTLDLCDTSGDNAYIENLPGSGEHERWYAFANASGASKLVCATSDGRLLDGDVSASRPNMQLQPYTRNDGSKGAWVLLAYEESKGMGHSLAAEEHLDTDNPVDDIIGDTGQDKPIKQDLGKNVIYHTFDFTQPDLVSEGHIVNLPALCGGLYPTYCDDPKTPDVVETIEENPTCSCDAGQPIPLYFEEYVTNADGTGEWLPNDQLFMQYRTEIARRARFVVQSGSKIKATRTAGAIIFKQGQEGQGRPADVFIRRIVVPENFRPKVDNPFAFENFECSTYLDESEPAFTTLAACPNDGVVGYNCNIWGEAAGDRLCGGTFADPDGGYLRRDHINLTSANVDMAVDAGPVDETPDDPTDDRYGTNKVLLWSQHDYNLGDESYGFVGTEGEPCDVLAGEVCPAMYSNARSHRGFIRGDFIVTAYAYSPNWAAGRNGNDRYNFYIRKSFDGGQTWTTTPATLDGEGVYYCREWRADPSAEDPDGTGSPPPTFDGFDANCVAWCPEGDTDCQETGEFIAAGAFEPARNMSEIKNNKETSSDPRVGATPPTYPVDGTQGGLPNLCPKMGEAGTWECIFPEDEYVDNIFFVAWGTGNNEKKTGTNDLGGEATPLDLYYTRTTDYGDNFLKVEWPISPSSPNYLEGVNETEWRYQRLAWGEEEQGECQLKATADGSKVYAIFHQLTPVEADPDEPITRWYPWEVEESHDNDLWFRRVIFWPEEAVPAEPDAMDLGPDSRTLTESFWFPFVATPFGR